MKAFLLLSIALVLGAATRDGAAQSERAAIITVDELIQAALQNNAELRAFAENHHAVTARIPQRSSLDDPQFNFEIEEAPRSEPFNASQWKFLNFGLTQRLPFPGKLAKAKQLAQIDAAHAHHEY